MEDHAIVGLERQLELRTKELEMWVQVGGGDEKNESIIFDHHRSRHEKRNLPSTEILPNFALSFDNTYVAYVMLGQWRRSVTIKPLEPTCWTWSIASRISRLRFARFWTTTSKFWFGSSREWMERLSKLLCFLRPVSFQLMLIPEYLTWHWQNPLTMGCWQDRSPKRMGYQGARIGLVIQQRIFDGKDWRPRQKLEDLCSFLSIKAD